MHENEQDSNINQDETLNSTETSDLNEVSGEEVISSEDFEETEIKAENPTNPNDSEKLVAEVNEFKDKYMRLYAEFENFRRRTAKEKADLIKNAGENILTSILPVLDDFERAMKSIEKADKLENTDIETLDKEISAIKEGVNLIHNKFFRILEQKGLKPMESSIGKPFNIDEHESITQIPAPSEDLKGKVVDEVEKGYYLHEKVVRFAKVVVGS